MSTARFAPLILGAVLAAAWASPAFAGGGYGPSRSPSAHPSASSAPSPSLSALPSAAPSGTPTPSLTFTPLARSPATLPVTGPGHPVRWLSALGALLLLAGGAVIGFGRRRRT